jgi:hypothetical protein
MKKIFKHVKKEGTLILIFLPSIDLWDDGLSTVG